jgi:DnaJ-class molecular chaperone
MKQGEHEWCEACDGEGRIGSLICSACGGLGCVRVSKEQIQSDIAEAAKLQATLDEVSKRIVADTKRTC